jgi:hypothetical protein
MALVALLFVPPYDFSWATPSVTPWLFPSTFASLFFYVGLLACWTAIRRNTPMWWIAVGAVLGIVFLGHTAPAVILGLLAVASVVFAPAFATTTARSPHSSLEHPASGGGRLAPIALVMGTALVVSAPFVYSIVVIYKLRIVATEALNWVAPTLAIAHAGDLLFDACVSPLGVLRIIGAIALVRSAFAKATADRRERGDRGAFLVVGWTAVAAVLFGYGWLQQLVHFRGVPSFIPQHEFYFHLRAAGYMLAGAGAWIVLTTIAAAVSRMLPSTSRPRYREAIAGALVLLAVYVTVRATYDAFQGKADFQEYRREALAATAQFEETRLLQRLRTETPPNAVVLATAEDSLYRVAPAGRAVVAIPSSQSNPYITQGGRDHDQKEMLKAVLTGDSATLRTLAHAYAVTHIVLGPDDTAALDKMGAPAGLKELSRRGGYSLYEVIAPRSDK